VPAGSYRLLRRNGIETFRCAPGPAGWRYFATASFELGSERIDVTVDAAWDPVRVMIETAAHQLVISRRGAVLDGAPVEADLAAQIEHPSPAFSIVLANRLTEPGAHDTLVIDPATLAISRESRLIESIGDEVVATPCGKFAARTFARDGNRFSIARDICVAAPGVELATYEALSNGPHPVA